MCLLNQTATCPKGFDDVQDAREAASFLKVHYTTLLQMVKQGELPAAKFGRSYVFIKEDLEEAIRSRYSVNGSATQVNDNGGIHKCRYTEGLKVVTGGLMSRSQLEKECGNLLTPKTKKKQQNSSLH